MMTVNFIGCGRIGKTIAKLLKVNNSAAILGVSNASIESATSAVRYIGEGTACATIKELPSADVYFITTQDNVIQMACQELVEAQTLKKNAIIIHCSGSMPSAILNMAKESECFVASVHPVKSFANPDISVNSFRDTFCAYEGDDEALPCATELFESIGGRIFQINSEHKKQYHAAMVMANNYLITLHFYAMQNLTSAGVDNKTAKILVSKMMSDALTNLSTLDYPQALTGPIQRGDLETIRGHLDAIQDDTTKNIYAALGTGTLPLTSHSTQILREINELFTNAMSSNR